MLKGQLSLEFMCLLTVLLVLFSSAYIMIENNTVRLDNWAECFSSAMIFTQTANLGEIEVLEKINPDFENCSSSIKFVQNYKTRRMGEVVFYEAEARPAVG